MSVTDPSFAVNGGFLDLTPERWQASLEAPVHAIFHLRQEAIAHMRQRREGAILLFDTLISRNQTPGSRR